jgi:hypothetical protein
MTPCANARRKSLHPERERGAALVVAILVLAILTVIGIALMLVTSTEARVAANEWNVNRAFYASDSGVRWARVQMSDYLPFLDRAEFTGNPFGTVRFELPAFRHGVVGVTPRLFELGANEIQVRVMNPSLLGRRRAAGERCNAGEDRCKYMYSFEVRARAGDDAVLRYSRALVADVELGPLPYPFR